MNIKINDSFIDPIFCPKDWTLAPSGMAFVDEKEHPWFGNLFVAGLRGKHLHRFVIDDGKVIKNEVFYYSHNTVTETVEGSKKIMYRRLRDVEFYNGSLWILADLSGIAKLTPKKEIRAKNIFLN